MKRIRKEMQEVEVEDYYAEMGDVITIPRRRGTFIVEDAQMTGGGQAHNDIYPDSWHVEARVLNDDGTYDPSARLVRFTQHTNSYNNVIVGVEKVGEMTRTFI